MSAALTRLHERIAATRSILEDRAAPLPLVSASGQAFELFMEGDDPQWITSYLQPYYARGRSPGRAEPTRVYVAATRLEDFMPTSDELVSGTVALGSGDRRVVRLPGPAGNTFLQLQRGGPEILVIFQNDSIFTFVPPSALAQHQQSAIRVLRCLTIMYAFNRGDILLHGAGVVAGGAVLLVGRKHAGKSTTALIALSEGFSFLTNDQALYRPSDGTVTGLPIAVGIRPPSLALFPALEARVRTGSLRHYYQTAAAYGGTHRPVAEPIDDERVTFLPSELCEAFGTRICPAATLNAVLVLGFEAGRTRIEVSHLSPTQAIAAFTENTFRTVCEKQPVWDLRVTRDQPNADAIRALADSVPCVMVRFGERHRPALVEQIRRHASGGPT